MTCYFIGIIILLISIISLFMPVFSILLGNGNIVKILEFSPVFGQVNFVIDPLSAFFMLIILIMGAISMVYAKGYLKPYIEKGKSINSHIFFFVLLILSMLTVVTCQNAFMFLICWEIMSLSSFFLVIFENENKEILKAGIQYLVFMHISMLFIMAAFIILSIKSGSYDFQSFAVVLQNNPGLSNIVFLLAFVGFGIKAGFVPFHNWLPSAHPAAPSHVSAVMSGVMIKTGIYGILRMLALIQTPSKIMCYTVLIISAITFLYGILYAIGQNDIKKMLAYSSIENIGIIGAGIGIGMLGLCHNNFNIAFIGFAGGILHILNHSIFKELLFFGAGNIYTKTHTRNMELLGGLAKYMPQSAGLFLIGAVAICGLPPFNGFVSEILIYYGMLKGLAIGNFVNFIILMFAFSSLAFVGTMAILCFTKAYSTIFLGTPRSEINAKEECSLSMILPMRVLAIFIVAIGVFPEIIFNKILLKPVLSLINIEHQIKVFHPAEPLLMAVSACTTAFIIFLLIFILLKSKLAKGKITLQNTWGCGYNKPNNRMQYTGSSYASPFLSMLKPLFKKVFDIKKPKNLFPNEGHFKLKIEDIEEAYILHPVLKFDEWFLSKFEKLQNGNLQTYIKYGLIFLAFAIIGSVLL